MLGTKLRKRLGVLTGGGDVPGLNPAIKALVLRGLHMDTEILGLRSGWEGIAYMDPARGFDGLVFRADEPSTWQGGYLMPLNRLNTRSIDRMGGTILQSTRTNPANVKAGDLPAHLKNIGEGHAPGDKLDITRTVLRNIEFLGLDGLVVIGGDDTLSYGARLAQEGVPVWGIPKTMDNDVPGTDYCLGFQTAIHRAAEFIDRMRSTVGSHSQTVLFRLFGRDAGFTALETALVTGADRVLIPEVAANIDRLAELVISDRENPEHSSMVVMSEGANLGMPVPEVGEADAYGHRKKINVAEFLADELAARVPGVRFLPVDLTYILRSGEPDVYDRHMAIVYANVVMGLVERGEQGRLAAYRGGEFISTDIPDKTLDARRVDPAAYNADRFRPNFEGMQGSYVPQPRG